MDMTEEAIMNRRNDSVTGAGAASFVQETDSRREIPIMRREVDRDIMQTSSREVDRDIMQLEGALRAGEPDVRILAERLRDNDPDLVQILMRLREEEVDFKNTLLALARLLEGKPLLVPVLGRLAPRTDFKRLLESVPAAES